ncbi:MULTISPECIES: PDR/VanB family oxidoreductase [Paraburkholderia]|uniref:Oxidoreductase n=1 Tax=Paraburkholderia podalyriae TaxID=1938811 RepID=A0ABR7PTD8_9BURK|nr:PDR/VanB family oxidoreductase [Paraburkholderia podalyriae]MBC8749550.1 oxidoreductase [Paraburkholderia podalyriae]
MKVLLADKRTAAEDICVFEFVSTDGAPLPAFEAGAHIDVKIADGLVRQYSLCNAPDETHRYRIGVLRDPVSRGGSVAMHQLQPGTHVEISAPRNLFPLDPDATHTVLVAGGIGVTPILAMAEQLAARGASFEMHYSTRSPERTAFTDRFAEPDLQPHTRIYHDVDPEEYRIDLGQVVAAPAPGRRLYVCGPVGFIDAVLERAKAAGWADDRLHREYFAAPAQPASACGAFQVRLHRSGQTIDVAADQSIVQALAAQGVEIQTACEQGVCGTCLTRVVEGEPEHRDSYLSNEERAANNQLLPCCSRSRSPVIVLDL